MMMMMRATTTQTLRIKRDNNQESTQRRRRNANKPKKTAEPRRLAQDVDNDDDDDTNMQNDETLCRMDTNIVPCQGSYCQTTAALWTLFCLEAIRHTAPRQQALVSCDLLQGWYGLSTRRRSHVT